MRIFRKIFSVILVFAILAFPVKTNAVSADTEDYVQRMIQYYLQYREAADDEIGILLDHLSETDPAQAQLWRKIMVSWAYHNSQMEMNTGILPDGLPNDDSMCIVIMGYGLRSDGTMREELIDRLVVGLSSALKYPNAYVAVTGGATSDVEGITEAGQMAQWLQERGISPDRIILEPKAMSFVHADKDAEPSIVLIDAVKGGKPSIKIGAPLILHDTPATCNPFGSLSQISSAAFEMSSIYLILSAGKLESISI